MNHSSDVYIHGRIIAVRYITAYVGDWEAAIRHLEAEENKAIKEGYQPFGKPIYIEDSGTLIQKMIKRS